MPAPLISEEEYTRIFKIHFKDICKFLNYYTHDQYLIEEVVQDVFVKLWEERNAQSIRHVKTYLMVSARNKILNVLRNHKNREMILSRWAEAELSRRGEQECIDREHFVKVLQYAVDLLPDRCRETFRLRYHEEMSCRDIARKQQISEKTVENQLNIALKRIRSYFLSHQTDTTVLLILFECMK